MNKLLLAASAVVLGLGIAQEAMADCNGFYLAGRGGIVKHKQKNAKDGSAGQSNGENKFDKERLMLSAALGYRYDYFRIEGEYVWRDMLKRSSYDAETDDRLKSKFKSYSYMLNGYFDLAPYSWLTPYVSAGIGLTRLKYRETFQTSYLSGVNENKRENNFTWSVGGGLSVKVTNRFNVDAGYRYYDMGKLRKSDITAHEVYGGLRYVF